MKQYRCLLTAQVMTNHFYFGRTDGNELVAIQQRGTQLTKHGQTNSCHYDKSVLQSWLLQSHSRGLYNGNSSLPLNLVLPNCFVCFGPRLRIRNDKSSSFILKARQFDCQCQHDKVLMAMGVGGGSKHRGA